VSITIFEVGSLHSSLKFDHNLYIGFSIKFLIVKRWFFIDEDCKLFKLGWLLSGIYRSLKS